MTVGHAKTAAHGGSNGHGNSVLISGYVAPLTELVADLIHGQHGKVAEHKFENRPVPVHGSSHGHTRNGILGNGGVQHPFFAKFFHQTGGLPKNTEPNILSKHENTRVPPHLLGHGLINRLQKADCLSHYNTPF